MVSFVGNYQHLGVEVPMPTFEFGPKPDARSPEAYQEILINHVQQIEAIRNWCLREVDAIAEEQRAFPSRLISLAERVGRLFLHGVWFPEAHLEASKRLQADDSFPWIASTGAYLHGYIHPSAFEHVKCSEVSSPTSLEKMHFVHIKGSETPSNAVRSLFNHLMILDSETTLTLAKITALLQCLGEEKFDALYGKESHHTLEITQERRSQLWPLFDQHEIEEDHDLQRGDLCSFENICTQLHRAQYVGQDTKHPFGPATVKRAVFVGDHKFIGPGLDQDGVSRAMIEERLLEEYNRKPAYDLAPQFAANVLYDHSKDPVVLRGIVEGQSSKRLRRESFDRMKTASGGKDKRRSKVGRLNKDRLRAMIQAEDSEVQKALPSFDVALGAESTEVPVPPIKCPAASRKQPPSHPFGARNFETLKSL